MLALALAACLALLPAAPAGAQSVSVSNITEPNASAVTVTATDHVATAFTTGGTTSDRYLLNSVVLDVLGSGSGDLDVTIHHASGSNPGTQIGSTLDDATIGSGGNTTYRAAGITLYGGTTYFVRVKTSGAASRTIRSTLQDTQTGTTGWSIADEGRESTNSGTSWSTISGSHVIKFTVNASTVQASTDSAVDGWSATLTVDASQKAQGKAGCRDASVSYDSCLARLSSQTFTHNGTTYEIRWINRLIYSGDQALTVRTEPALPSALRSSASFTVGARSFAYSDAQLFTSNKEALWTNPGFNWTNNQQVSVGISGTGISPVLGLVKNISEFDGGTESTTSNFAAQAFTTGASTSGYSLSSVIVRFGRTNTATATTVRIRTTSGTSPNMAAAGLVATLTRSGTGALTLDQTFTAPGGTYLAPSTTYWVTVHEAITTRATLMHQANPSETGQTGWRIANSRLHRASEGSTAWTTASNSAFRIALRGYGNFTVSNMAETRTTTGSLSTSTTRLNAPFTTGGTSTDSYLLDNVVVAVGSNASNLTVKIYDQSTTGCATGVSVCPNDQVGTNLTRQGSAASGDITYRASSITLTGATTYYVELTRGAGNAPTVGRTTSNSQTGSTAWLIGDIVVNNNGTSAWSESLAFWVKAAATFAAPTVTATATKDQVSLTWPAVTGATKYQYRYKVTSAADTTYTTPANLSSAEFTARTKVITELAPGTGYTFQVRANGATGAWGSATATFTTTVYNTNESNTQNDREFMAQEFTTGANAAGYRLDYVYVFFRDHADNDSTMSAIKIRNSTATGCPAGFGDCPGSTVHATMNRDGSGALRGVQRYSVPSGTNVTLAASTEYFVTFNEGISTQANRAYVETTTSNSETGDTGWSIDDGRYRRTSEASNWSYDGSRKYQIGVGATALTAAPMTVTATAAKDKVTLTWSAVTGATKYQYRYKITSAADTTYTTPADVSSTEFTARSKVITGLAPGVGHTFQVRANGATGVWGQNTATPTTTLYNTDQTTTSHSSDYLAQSFTTGNNAGGYRLDRVYVDFRDHSSNDSTTTAVKVRNQKTTGCGTGVHSCPGGTVLATLTQEGSAALRGVRVFNAPANVTLAAVTGYWLTINEGVSSSRAAVDYTISNIERGGAPWGIGDNRLSRTSESSAYVSNAAQVYKIGISATTIATPTLSHSGLTHNSVTLTIANHSSNWYHKGTHSGASCSTVVTTTSDNLTGLTPSTSYTYKAYSNSTCTTELTTNATDVEFTTLAAPATPRLTHSSLTHNSVTLTIANYSGTWYHKGTHSGASCSTGITSTTDNLTGLSPSTSYTYKAYSNSSCTTEVTTNATDAEFTTPAAPGTPTLTPSAITHNSATLTITNHTTAWWYRQTVPSTGTCTPRTSTQRTASLVGLTADTTYTYKAFSNSGCTTEIASTTFATLAPPATPTNLRARAFDKQVSLSWDSAARATGYQVQSKALAAGPCGTSGYGNWTNVGGGTRHTVGGLTNRTRYCFRVRATNAAGESTASTPAAATPREPVQFTVTMVGDYGTVNEGDRVAIVVTLSEPPGRHVAIPLKVTRGTAEPEDVGDAPVVDIWGDIEGRRSASGYVSTFRDDDTDDDTFTVSFGELPDGVAAGDRRHWGVTIRDTGGPPGEHEFRVSDADAHEPESLYQPQYLHFEVTLDPASEHEAGVDYSTREGTATEWWDYEEGVSGRLTFDPGETSKTVRVEVSDDASDEGCETMFLDLAHALGAVVADDEALGTIYDEPQANAAAWLFPSASDRGRRGVVRVVNRSDAPGEVTVTATDDAGRTYPALTLEFDARGETSFDSRDLEVGNPDVGLTGATGPGTGDWRLAFSADALDIAVLPYVETPDGFAAGMAETAPVDSEGSLRIVYFDPPGATSGRSVLRLVNPGSTDARATVTGIDDAGRSPGEPVRLTVRAGTACTMDASQLESGFGLVCGAPQPGLGDGAGRWRLKVASDTPLIAMNLLSASDGRLSNLSAVPAPNASGAFAVPQFPSTADPNGRRGLLGVANRSARPGTVTIRVSDEGGDERAVLTLSLAANAAMALDADDLELGNRSKGLAGGAGTTDGPWRLALSADVPLDAAAYARGPDGFLSALPTPYRAGTEVAIRTAHSCSVPPLPVENIVLNHYRDHLLATWNESVRATGYDVTYTEQGTGVTGRAAWNRPGTRLEITCDIRPEHDHCVVPEHAYTIRVRARNEAGVSEWRTSEVVDTRM